MRVTRVADASSEAISITEARAQCRIIGADSDDVLAIYIEAARNHVETITRNAMVESTYIFYFDSWADAFSIYRPINSITTFEYKTASNTGTYSGSLTGSDYHLDSDQGVITLADDAMSDIEPQYNAVKITAVVGETNIGNIKGNIKMAMLLLIGNWHENREHSVIGTITATLPMGFNDLIAPYRAHRL